MNQESFFDRLRREDNIRETQKKREQLEKRARLAHSAAYKDGECLLNLLELEDFAQNDERKAKKFQKKHQEQQDAQNSSMIEEQKRKRRQISLENFNKMLKTQKPLKKDIEEQKENHPEKQNEIYATLKIPEIVEGLTKDDFKRMEREKALNFREQLDKFVESEQKVREDNTFYGMTDEEIMVNQEVFKQLGLL